MHLFCIVKIQRPINSNASAVRHSASKCAGPSSMDNRERRLHARCVYPTQDTSHMGTVRVEQEEIKADKNNSEKSGREERGHEGKKSQTRPN